MQGIRLDLGAGNSLNSSTPRGRPQEAGLECGENRRAPKSREARMRGCLILLLVLAEPARGQGGPRTDLFGDPLPSRALARLGTVRFWHPDTIFEIAYSPDGKRL